MSTISDLQAEIDELEKRIKAISNAQTTMTQLMAMNEYFEKIQTYLVDLNNTYESHIIDSNEYSTQINHLQNQIATLEEKINNTNTGENVDLSEIQANIQTIQQDLETLKDGSETTVAEIDTALEELQTDHQNMQDDIDVNTTNISTLITDMSNVKTNITNITTTQNNLSSTQSNLSSTVTAINSRLSTVESNVDAITGGVDVSELNNKVELLEQNRITHTFVVQKYSMFLNLTENQTMSSLYYYYKTDNSDMIQQKFKLQYESEESGTINVDLLQNGEVFLSFTIDLENNPSEYELECLFYPTQNYQNFQFRFTATTSVNFKNLIASIYGINPFLFVTDQDLKACCFDNTAYILRYDNNEIKGARLSLENLSILPENLNNYSNLVSDIANARSVGFGPEIVVVYNVLNTTKYHINFENALNEKYYHLAMSLETDSLLTTTKTIKAMSYSFVPVFGTQINGASCFIYNNKPAYIFATNSGDTIFSISDLDTLKTGNWYFCTAIFENNYINNSSSIRSTDNMEYVAFHEDGNMYLIKSGANKSISKIGPGGQFATAYYQTDGSINVYINRLNKTYKYHLEPQEDNTYKSNIIEIIDNCDCVYEMLNNKLITHKTNQDWSIIDVSQ